MITCATVNNSQIDSLLEDLESISRLPMPAGCAWSGPFAVLTFDRSSPPAGSPTLSLSFAEHDLFDFENLFDESAEYSVMTPPSADYQPQEVSSNITQSEKASEYPPLRLSEFPSGYSDDFEGLSFSVVRTLLNHYQQSVVELYTPALPTSESPWKLLYLPKVMGCIGEIMLSGDGPHIMICLLFSILATSAYGMQVHGEQESTHNVAWQELGKTFAIKAKSRLKLALAQISTCPSTTMKYKDYLMALLSMVTIGVCLPFHYARIYADDPTGL
jgi:hypothetical protein